MLQLASNPTESAVGRKENCLQEIRATAPIILEEQEWLAVLSLAATRGGLNILTQGQCLCCPLAVIVKQTGVGGDGERRGRTEAHCCYAIGPCPPTGGWEGTGRQHSPPPGKELPVGEVCIYWRGNMHSDGGGCSICLHGNWLIYSSALCSPEKRDDPAEQTFFFFSYELTLSCCRCHTCNYNYGPVLRDAAIPSC